MFNLKTFSQSLKQEFTRDLAWALFAPSLIKHTFPEDFHVEPTNKRLHWIQELDASPAAAKIMPNMLLGRYYESLWTCFFNHDEQYRLVANNLPIRDNGRTFGELDFIVKDNHGGFIHLEVAVKFYLFHNKTNTIHTSNNSNWPGPNSKDTLEKKWQKILTHQTGLSQLPICKPVLQKLGINEPVKQAISLKGYLFRPPYSQQTPYQYNPENPLYHYYYSTDFVKATAEKHLLGIIPKQHRISQTHSTNSISICSKDDVINVLHEKAMPVMAGYFTQKGDNLQEIERFFIMPDQWPNYSLSPDTNIKLQYADKDN